MTLAIKGLKRQGSPVSPIPAISVGVGWHRTRAGLIRPHNMGGPEGVKRYNYTVAYALDNCCAAEELYSSLQKRKSLKLPCFYPSHAALSESVWGWGVLEGCRAEGVN